MIPSLVYLLPLYPLVARAALEVDFTSKGEHVYPVEPLLERRRIETPCDWSRTISDVFLL